MRFTPEATENTPGIVRMYDLTNIKNIISQASVQCDYLIVYLHWGTEDSKYFEQYQRETARELFDCGADIIIGGHPHVLQGIEKYKGRYIVYSLGNFCYGGHTNPADKDTMIFQQTFCIKNGKLKKDDSRAKVIPCSISSSSQYNNFQPTVLSGGRKRTLINKINRISKGKHVTIKSNGQLGTGHF